MRKLNKTVSKILFSGILLSLLLLVGSCENWMSNDNFMEQIESEVHDANASLVNVYVRYANSRWGTTEPQGNTAMKVDVASKISAVTSDEYGFVKWAAFLTKDFPINKQHSNLIFVSEKNYEANYKGKELPETVVRFADPKSPNTNVTIYSPSNEVFIVPIVTKRPEVESSYPVENDKTVKNTFIEIYFTKAIDEESLIDEEGNLNFNVTSSSYMRQNDEDEDEDEEDDENSSGNDITDYFNYALKRNGKCLKLTLKEGKILDNNQNVTVILHEGLRDKYGFEMNGNDKFTFKTGTKSDSLAPIIQILVGGNGKTRLGDFNSYHNDDVLEGSATEASVKAPKDIESDEYTSAIVAQRVYDKLYLYVKSIDIIGADGNLTLDDKNQQEENVGYIGIAASLYIENTDKNNNPVTKDSNKLDRNIAKTNNVYIPGSIDPKADTSGLFTEIFRNIVPLENKDDSNSEYSGGEIFSYDVSNLPDGLIKIDVWAVDMTGNSGEDLEKGGKFYNNYDNGFKSIFVVKDTTPIDSAEVKAKKQVKSNSAQAPYYWYNKNTINKMNLFDTPENKIHDAGHPKLRALDKNLWWTFKVGNVTEKISAAANDIWKRIHDETTGETSIPYSLSDAQAPAKDGPVDITLYLKDDLGNLSEPVLLDSIMYDNTEPTVTLKNGKGDFINAKGEPVQNNSRDDEIEQILKVDFTENNAENNVDAVSGIRQMEIHISKNGVEVPAPLNDSFKVLYVPSTVANPTPETSTEDGLREIKIAQNDSATTKNKVVFDVDDSSKITSGIFFIYGLTLGDTDGPWTVSVNLFDSALNPAESATTIMKRDTTPPVIEKIFVNDAQKRQVYNDTTKDSWWMPKSRYDSNGQYYNVTFDIYVNETGSGLKFIKLPKNVDIDFTDNTKLSADGINLKLNEDYSFDSETNTITMLDEFDPKFINTEGSGNKIHFTLEDVKLNVNDSASGNKAGIEVEDFVDNITENTTLTYSDKSTGTLIFTDTKAPEITDLRIEDSEKNGDNNPDDIAYNNQYTGEDDTSTKYTDDQTVTLLLTLEPETVSGSGVKTVHLSENAEFTSDTEIEVDGKLLSHNEWSRSDNKSITFKKVFIEANKLKFKNVKLDSSVNGEQFIYAYLTDFAGLDTEVSKKSLGIIYDDVQPEIKKIDWVAPKFVAKGSANGNTVEDQTFQIDFKEVTSGVKVIKFDINYKPVDGAESNESYATPFDLSNFEIKYGDRLLTKNTDYEINGKYIILNTPVITENGDNGTFNFENIKLCDTKAEGNYTIYVTLLDAAENINPQKETEGAVYKEEIVIDTTSPVVEKVQVIGAKKREVYGNPSDTHKWWMPKESSPNVKLDVTINESGSSIQKITVSEDVEFTPETKLYLKKSGKYLVENNDYILDRSENTITLLDKFFAEKLIRNDNENQFILENVKLKKANTLDGNKVALGLKDFVRNEGSNQIGTDYTIYFEEDNSTEQGTLVYLDSEKPEVAELKIKDSEQNDDNNPDIKAWDKDNYTDNDCVVLTLKLKAESENDGSGVKKITLSNNAKFAPNGASVIRVDGTTLNINQDYKFIAESEVEFTKVFTGNEEIEFTDIQLPSDTQGKQNVKVYLTDFVSLESEIASSNDVVYDNVSPRINKIEWTSDDSTVSLTNSESNKIENKTLNIDFTEETAGVKVIKFDITHGDNTYDKPFEEGDFELIYTAEGKTEKITDYTIDNRYIELTKPLNSGKLSFNNLKLNNAPDEGQYIINVTLLDAAENKNAQTDSSIYNCPISIDTTAPVIERVDVLDAIDRTEYNDSTNTATWWMPADKFESADNLSKVDLKVTINEIGSGIRYIKLSEDAEFTDNTVLTRVDGNVTLDNPKDYKLVDTHTIELLNPNNPKLNGTAGNPIVIKLANVKLNNINKAEGNKVKVEVEDFVYHTHTNAVTDGYKIYYDEKDYSGLLVYADYTKPVISELKIVDSEQAANVNPDAKGVDFENYTDNENVVLYLTIKAETLSHGSGVNKITLVNNAAFTDNTEIFAGNTKLESGYTISDDKQTVTFNKVFTAETVIKFTNVKFVNATNDNLNQTITAKLTDFVGLTSEEKSDAIVFDIIPAEITKLEWVAPEGVAKGSANTNEVTDQTFKVEFTEETAGVKVIKFDVTYDGAPEGSPSYDSPFSMTNFKLYYGDAELTSVTDYTIEDGRYIVLTNPKTTGSFTFENLKLRNASAEGEYNIKVTLLDAAENRNWNANTADVKYNKKIFIDTTAPVVEKVLVEDAQKREVYNNASDSQKWWMPKEKFEGEDLSKVSLQITVNEAGSGLKLIKLSQDVEFTSKSKLKKGTEYLAPGTEYTLDTTNNTITLLNYENPKLRGSANEPAVVFTLENVKLNNLNTASGNKIAVTVEDFVTNPGSNKIDGTENFKVYYPDGTDGTLIFADSEKPSITTLKIEDSAQNTVTNPDNKAWDKEKYTDSQNVILTLKLTAETTNAGSGIKVIQLKNNAEFTENTFISVDDTELTTGFTFAEDKKSVEFDKVFVAANVIKFTNVKLPATEGTYSINADVKDFAGWNAAIVKVSDNSIMLDTTNPAITKVNWKEDDDTVTAGTTNTAVVGNQSLQVAFTETLSGVKVIKFDITPENSSTPYAYPFGDEGLSVKAGDETLEKGSDYIFAGKYIILTTPVKSNTLSFRGIKLAETAEECVYTIKVTLLDAAENRALDTKTIAIDVTKPVIDGELRIPNLIHSVELSTGSTANEKYWLPQSYVNATVTTGQPPSKIPVYLNIKERTSGVKIFTFSNDVVLTNAVLYKIDDTASDETASDARTQIDSDEYEINNDAHTITIKEEAFAKDNFSKKNDSNEEVPFIILVDNIGFKNADSTSTASENSISITLSDVAKNVSEPKSTSQTYIYSDSIAPAAPTSFTIKDRENPAASGTISASSGYTKESIVDMTFNLSASEQYGSGYHKFTLTGAKFKSTSDVTNASDATILTMKNGSTAITGLSYEIEDEGRTLVIKKSGAAAELKAVIKQAVSVTINNVHLDNPTTQGQHTVTLTANDLTGLASSSTTSTIKLDTTEPELKGGSPFTANYTSGPAYYNPAVNVYPHANGETGYGVKVTSGTETIYTFYTATTYETGFYQYNGVVSEKPSTAVSEPDTEFTHGAVLGFHAKDNLMLRASQGTSYFFMKYIADSDLNKDKEYIIQHGTDLRPNATTHVSNSAESNKTAYDYTLWYKFATGKYSAVILDAAGNVSDVFRFAVVQDTKKPDTNIQNRVLLQRPDESYNIYRNAETVTGTSSDFSSYYAYSSSDTPAIRTKKYVTKKASEKYKIVLNLGSTYSNSSLVSRLSGENVSNVEEYAELKGTLTASPIEQYAISTWYGSWPTDAGTADDASTLPYIPVVPYNTKFPSGQAQTASSTNSDYAIMARNYFGGDSSFSSYWRIESGNANWHSAKYDSGKNYTDSGNGIVSYIDSDNNLIIEVPNTRSTAPISVFLRDGCGNMDFVVLGLEKSGNKETAVSIILDNKLGGVTTTNGRAKELQVMQNPFVSTSQYVSGKTSGPTWSVNGYSPKYYWNLQSGNGDAGRDDATKTEHGVGDMYGFFKDKTLGATYYNPRISVSSNTITQLTDTSRDKAYWTKLGLTFRWHDKDDDTALESAMFTSNINKAIQNTDLAGSNTAYDYTCRALLYCTTDSTEPSYDKIVKSHIEGRTGNDAIQSGDRGFRTEWVGARASGTGNSLTILIDYPQPDYDLLGWTVNNSSHEPVPYYIWYIFEDRVGNYELAKVVNSSFDDKGAAGSDYPLMDKWLYDGKAPEVTVIGTTKKPNEIKNDADEVKALVSDNNGYVPYLDTTNKRIWVSSDQDRTSRISSLIKSPSGWGVTNKVENGTSLVKNREYLPFANLTVSKEITGIRAFAWSTYLTPPAINKVLSTDNTQGDRYDATEYPYGAWYAGSGASTTATDIGWTYSYTNSTNRYLDTTKYTDKYSGTKINTIIPQNLISTTADKELFLHVMDWTGNIATYRMGSAESGLKFRNDITSPSWEKDQNAYGEDGYYYVADEYDGKDKLIVIIAGNEAGSEANHEEFMKVYMPTNYFSDTDSGFAGYRFGNSVWTVNDITKDDDGRTYLKIPYSEYSNWPVDGKKPGSTDDYLVPFYCFDKVGNYYWNSGYNKPCQFTGVYDTSAPEIASVSFVTEKDKGTEFIHTSTDEIKNVSGYGKVTDFTAKTGTTKLSSTTELEAALTTGKVQEIWVKKAETSRFHINLTSDIADFGDAIINKWNSKEWSTVSSWETKASSGTGTWNHSGSTYRPDAYNLLDFDSAGTYYQIIAKDLAGNKTYQYFKLYLDDQGPELAIRSDSNSKTPTIELGKGSINKVEENGEDIYYFTAGTTKSEALKLKFAIKDSGIDNSLQTFQYSLTGDENSYKTITDYTAVELPVTNDIKSVEKIYLKDVLGNVSELTPGFDYPYENADGENTSESITKLTLYEKNKPDAPTISPAEYKYISGYRWNNPIYTTVPVVSEIETFGYGYDEKHELHNYPTGEDETTETNPPVWTSFYTEIFESNATKTDNVVLIKGAKGAPEDYADVRQKLKITLPEPSGTIIGYVKGIPNTTTPGVYSLRKLSNIFVEDLPLSDDYSDSTLKYYAVDVVGNYSDALSITFTYDNPHKAQDVELIENPKESNKIPQDVKNAMADDSKEFAKYYRIAIPSDKQEKDKTGNIYFNGDYMVLRCSLYKPAGDSYNETPNKVELHDVWTEKNKNGVDIQKSEIRGETGDAEDVFKIYTSSSEDTITKGTGENATKRYYCYIVFKPGQWTGSTFNAGSFDNNDDYDGSVLNFRIKGPSAESDFYSLNPDEETKKYGWKLDNQAPTINEYFSKSVNGIKVLYNYSIKDASDNEYSLSEKGEYNTKDIKTNTKAYDHETEENKPTNVYSSGTKLYCYINNKINNKKTTCIKDNYTDWTEMKYQIVETSGYNAVKPSYSDNNWLPMEPVNSNYVYALPDVKTPHHYLALFLMDKLGNITEPYYIAKNNDSTIQYWLLDNLLNQENVEVSITPTEDWKSSSNDYTFDVKLPKGSVINYVTATVNGKTLTVKEVKFSDYTKNQPSFNNGVLSIPNNGSGWVNIDKGLTVKVAKITQSWNPKSVTIQFNNSKSVTCENFVPAFTLTKDYIETQAATWELNKRSGYEVFVTVKNGPTADNITSIAANNAKVDTWTVVEGTDNKTVKVILKDVVAQDWGKDQNVTLRINDSFDTDPVLTVPQIAPEHIGINALTWDDGTAVEGQEGFRKFTAELTIPDGASAVTGLSVSNATLISSNIASSPVKAEFKANKGWTQKPIRLQITGDTNNGSSTSSVTVAKEVLKLDELTKADLSITVNPNGYVKGTTEYELTVNVPANVAIPDNTETATYISAGNATIAKLSEDSVNKYKLTVAPDWDEKPVSVTVQNFEPFSIFTIDAIAKEDIEIKQNGSAPEYVAGTTEYVLTISVPGNATLNAEDIVVTPSTTEIGKCSASGSWNPGSKEYTLTVTPGWENKKVYLNIKQLGDIEVFEVAKRPFTSEDFELGNASPVAGEEGKYTIPVNLKNGAPASEITNVTGDYGVKASWDSTSNTVTVWDLPSANWNDQTITLTFNADAEGKNGIDKVTDVIVPAKPLQATNITLGSASKQDDGSYTIDVTFGENVPATALKKVATDMDAITGVFEKTSAEGVTQEKGTITLTGVPEASWTDEYKIKLVINEGDAQFTIEDPVIVIEKKVLKATDVTIDKGTSTVNYASVTITLPDEVTLNDVKYIGTGTVDVTNAEWNSKIWILQPKDSDTISTGEVLELDTSNGKVNITLFEAPSNPEGNGSQSNDAGNTGSRAGFFSGLISRITGASSESSYTPVETDKTRSITIPNWTTDDLNSSDVADKVNESSSAVTKKAAKKAKKAQKAAKSVKTPVEQPIASETVESVAVTSAATLGDVVETVTETAAEVIASANTTETSVIADTVEPSAAMNLPVYSEPLAEEEMKASDSRALIWPFIALITAALVTAAAVLLAKRRK